MIGAFFFRWAGQERPLWGDKYKLIPNLDNTVIQRAGEEGEGTSNAKALGWIGVWNVWATESKHGWGGINKDESAKEKESQITESLEGHGKNLKFYSIMTLIKLP